jgi:hypothetical protein
VYKLVRAIRNLSPEKPRLWFPPPRQSGATLRLWCLRTSQRDTTTASTVIAVVTIDKLHIANVLFSSATQTAQKQRRTTTKRSRPNRSEERRATTKAGGHGKKNNVKTQLERCRVRIRMRARFERMKKGWDFGRLSFSLSHTDCSKLHPFSLICWAR